MKKLKEWVRARETVSSEHFINGMPDIATNIIGYEVM